MIVVMKKHIGVPPARVTRQYAKGYGEERLNICVKDLYLA